jgi:hypothetical protein
VLAISDPERGECILRPQVRVLPEPDHEEQAVARGVDVEVVPVVEVAIAGVRETHRLRDLVHEVVVHLGYLHGDPLYRVSV